MIRIIIVLLFLFFPFNVFSSENVFYCVSKEGASISDKFGVTSFKNLKYVRKFKLKLKKDTIILKNENGDEETFKINVDVLDSLYIEGANKFTRALRTTPSGGVEVIILNKPKLEFARSLMIPGVFGIGGATTFTGTCDRF